jgi:hypothetical protein
VSSGATLNALSGLVRATLPRSNNVATTIAELCAVKNVYLRRTPMRIDCHNHVIPRLALELVQETSAFGLRVVDG